ncbi:hypothetical protein QOT17_004112 [Balamuthia mandrillaris]
MKKCLLALVVCAALIGVTVGADDCYEASYANSVVEFVLASNVPFPSEETPTQGAINNVIRTLVDALDSVSSTYKQVAFVTNGDGSAWYGVGFCKNYEGAASGLCRNTKYYANVRNPLFFGDEDRHDFIIEDDVPFEIATAEETGSSAYDPTSRPWWPTQEGWSEAYPDSDTKQVVTTILAPYGLGRVGVDRTPREPCSFCLMNKDAVPLVLTTAATTIKNPGDAASLEDLSEITSRLLNFMRLSESDEVFDLYLATGNDVYISLFNCANDVTGSEICASGQEQYYATILCPAFFRDSKIYTYNLFEDGSLRTTVSVDEREYIPSQRPWFVHGEGWTLPYTFSSGFVSRSFTARFEGGVVAADLNLDLPCSGCPEAETCETCPDQCEECVCQSTDINFNFAGMIPA